MNCKECRRLLEDYLDHELSERKADAVRAHLGGCSGCAAELRTLETEQALFERYRENQAIEAASSASGWEALQERISRLDERVTSTPRRAPALGFGWLRLFVGSPLLRQAVYATLLIAVSVAGTLIMVRRDHSVTPQTSVSGPGRNQGKVVPAAAEADNAGLDSAMRAVRRAEQEYLQAIQLLNEIVNRRKPSLDPRLVREIELNLKSIDQSIEATRHAYYERPSDPELAQYMLAAYSKKVELLQELAT